MSALERGKGTLCGLGAYLVWGFFPLYFKTLAHVSPSEVLAHRVLWAAVCLLGLVGFTGGGGRLRSAVITPRTLATLVASTLLISTNWFFFLYAVGTGQVLQSSLGYFITPLVSVLLGFAFLGERLRPLQRVSVGLALAGVAIQAWMVGEVPAIALILAGSFGAYGLIRKIVGVDAVTGLAVETMLLSPLALVFMVYLGVTGKAVFLSDPGGQDGLLVLAGAVTALPLVLYGVAVRRLRLATLGLLQYFVPTMHFMLAVFAFGESFTGAHLTSFGFIWLGLAIYTWDGRRGPATLDDGSRAVLP